MSLLKRAAKGTVKTAKKIGNAIAVETKAKRPFVTKTDKLKDNNNDILKEIKNFIKITQKIEELSKESHFSYLEKLSRKTKDELKSLFSKVQTELNIGDHIQEAVPLYISKRNKFLNEAHKISKNIYNICKTIEQIFKNAITNNSYANQELAPNNINELLSNLNNPD